MANDTKPATTGAGNVAGVLLQLNPIIALITSIAGTIRTMWAQMKAAHPQAVIDITTGAVYESMAAATAAGALEANLRLEIEDAELINTLLQNSSLLKAEAGANKKWAEGL